MHSTKKDILSLLQRLIVDVQEDRVHALAVLVAGTLTDRDGDSVEYQSVQTYVCCEARGVHGLLLPNRILNLKIDDEIRNIPYIDRSDVTGEDDDDTDTDTDNPDNPNWN